MRFGHVAVSLAGLVLLAGVASMLSTSIGLAQPSRRSTALLTKSSAAPHIKELDTTTNALEQELDAAIKNSKVVFDATSDKKLEDAMDAVLDTAMNAQNALETEIRGGKPNTPSVGPAFLELEDYYGRLRDRWTKLVSKMNQVASSVHKGTIKIDPKATPPAEINELKDVLEPGMRRQYKAVDPRFGYWVPPTDTQSELRSTRIAQMQCRSSHHQESLADLLIARADAAIGLACAGVCSGPPWAQCAGCIAAGSAVAVKLLKGAKEAYSDCNGKRWKFLRRACKAAVIVGFLAALA